jgi:hypothetical protein
MPKLKIKFVGKQRQWCQSGSKFPCFSSSDCVTSCLPPSQSGWYCHNHQCILFKSNKRGGGELEESIEHNLCPLRWGCVDVIAYEPSTRSIYETAYSVEPVICIVPSGQDGVVIPNPITVMHGELTPGIDIFTKPLTSNSDIVHCDGGYQSFKVTDKSVAEIHQPLTNRCLLPHIINLFRDQL